MSVGKIIQTSFVIIGVVTVVALGVAIFAPSAIPFFDLEDRATHARETRNEVEPPESAPSRGFETTDGGEEPEPASAPNQTQEDEASQYVPPERAPPRPRQRVAPAGDRASEETTEGACRFAIELNTARMTPTDDARLKNELGGFLLDRVCRPENLRPVPTYWPAGREPSQSGCIPYEHQALHNNQLCWRFVPARS